MTTQAAKASSRDAVKTTEVGKSRPRANKPRTTKKAQLIQMLSRKAGADVPSISKKLGWLPHTTRAALTGLRKAGFEISAEKPGNGKPSCYRVIAEPAGGTA
ncbi:DUF3489 domain-containing protein [Pseudohalocynthiibacter aestuariivivens]|uniref:DUF3489 domain-containing protein n=1 Tax=Pseudohalocynthiibacter aestuariivivens TaxID=1591409 RepID=A0ABV5JEU3_9RHOB|nr:DUF3489 domain-containing protein [Pseudohalocynthiibacter aestuariivivens]MBS9718508.1 DUF3489 domain-containing protein [Pseudohalocynthiibacter aestuariivivens]